jgi:hypothetical protein
MISLNSAEERGQLIRGTWQGADVAQTGQGQQGNGTRQAGKSTERQGQQPGKWPTEIQSNTQKPAKEGTTDDNG